MLTPRVLKSTQPGLVTRWMYRPSPGGIEVDEGSGQVQAPSTPVTDVFPLHHAKTCPLPFRHATTSNTGIGSGHSIAKETNDRASRKEGLEPTMFSTIRSRRCRIAAKTGRVGLVLTRPLVRGARPLAAR